MIRLGYTLIVLGFLGGALAASITPKEVDLVNWTYYAPALIAAIVGVALVQWARRGAATAEHKVASDLQTLDGSLSRITTNATQLDGDKTKINVYDLHGRIDELFREDLTAFADARKSIIHAHGLQEYAELMNHFAAGERYINRVWSASVDGYEDEAREYIGLALEQFAGAHARLKQLQSAAVTLTR